MPIEAGKFPIGRGFSTSRLHLARRAVYSPGRKARKDVMLEKLRLLQYRARIKLYRADQLRSTSIAGRRTIWLEGGGGEPLVYLGACFGAATWYPFLQGLSRSFAVRALLPPGLDGGDGEGIDDLDDLLFHYLDLFAALGLDRFDLVAASFGGRIAAELAMRCPHLIKRLVLVDALGLDPVADSAVDLADNEQMRRQLLARPDSFLGDLLLPSSFEEAHDLQTVHRVVARIGAGHPKLRARLARITTPTLVVWGAEDMVVPYRHGEAFREAIPGARLTRIPDCGHLPMFEQEENFVAAVTSFLRAD